MEKFACVVADPPWLFGDSLPGETRGASSQYKTMSVDDICKLSLPPIFDNAYLFLWRVSAMVEEAYRVVRAWGFVPKSEIVWNKLTANGKPHFGMGRHVRASHETCIVALRGTPFRRSGSVRSTFAAPTREHSEKPDEFFQIVESFCFGPRVELFARKQREGWTCIGDELGSELTCKP